MLRIYDVGGKLLNGIKSMYIKSLAFVRIKGGGSDYFKTDSAVRKIFIISPWLLNVYMDAVLKDVKMGMGGFMEEKREGRLPRLLYTDNLVLCAELEEDLKAMVRCFVKVCKRRGLKTNAEKSKWRGGWKCEVNMERM